MKKKILFFMAMTLGLAEFVRAQDIATLTGFPLLKNAVSRQYTAKQSIYYCDDGVSHYFVLYDYYNPNNAIVSEFPVFLELKDFEVFEDMVYFCGIYPQPGTPYGFVGQISVQDLFFNNGPYNVGTYFYINEDPCPPTDYLPLFDRMDVFKDEDNVHLAIVGEVEHSIIYGVSLRRTACDIWFDGVYWVGQVLNNKEDYSNDDVSLFSIDNRVQTPYFTLGGNYNSTSEPLLTLKVSSPGNCYVPIVIEYDEFDSEFSRGGYDAPVGNLIPRESYYYYPNPREYEVNNRCGDFKTQNSHE